MVGTFLEADSMVRNKAGKVPDFIYLLSTCIRAYSMPETVLGTLQILNHLILLTMLWGGYSYPCLAALKKEAPSHLAGK